MIETATPKSKPKASLALILALLLTASFALASEKTSMRFDRLTMDDGLSQSSVAAITQDEAGFMWFATESGLDRFDGFNFRHYHHESGNDRSLANNFARDIARAADGSLWVATDGGGVSRWLPETDDFVTYRHDPDNDASLADDHIRTILPDARGYVWVGTRDSGLDRLHVATGAVTHYTHDVENTGSLSNDSVYALTLDAGGTLWIGTRAGLDRLDPETGSIERFASQFGSNQVRSLLIDHAGLLWVGTGQAGLALFDPASGEVRRFTHEPGHHHSISSNRIETIFEDSDHRVWVGTDAGLSLYDRDLGEFVTYRADATDLTSLGDDFVFSIFQDRGGILWIGTRTEGLNKWNPRSWSFGHVKAAGSHDNALSDTNVTSFTEDGSGNVWVGTFGGGLNVLDRTHAVIDQFRHEPGVAASLSDDRVMALLTDAAGSIWAGTMTGGLNRIDPATGAVTTYRHDPRNPNSLAADGIMALHQDSGGALWVGTFGGGVSRFDAAAGSFVNFPHDPDDPASLSASRATSIVEDNHGVIWVGTDGGGVNRFDQDTGTWQHFIHDADDPASLSADAVYALHVDDSGMLWIGTRSGLNQLAAYDPRTATARFRQPAPGSLSTGEIYSIQSDQRGNLWLGTARGLQRYSPWGATARSFHVSHGLQGEEFNFGASFASGSGKLYFGGSNGFNVFDPAELSFNRQPPAVVVTSVDVLNEPLATDQPYERITEVNLGYEDDVVTFGIAALDYASAAENRFSYQLEGFDDDWVDAGTERRITYTNLDGGDYTFRVRASNSDGFWNNEGVAVSLRVEHPPWKTWWAYTLYALAIVAAVLAFVRHHARKFQREAEYSRRLEHEVHARTDELKRRNSELRDANDQLQQASTTDPLTGLRNRRYLFEQVSKDVDLVLRHYRDGTETIRPGGNNDLLFLMVDLDHFKPVNDSAGHEAGDELLLQIRDVLLEACRYSDDVIRWGGDEFLVVARDTNREFAATLAERIRSSLSQRVFPIGNGQVARTTASIGYASFPFLKDQPELLTWEEVLGVADAAMYEAKRKRNAWLGIEGIDWELDGEELYREIKNNPGRLAQDGLIRAIESLDDAAESAG